MEVKILSLECQELGKQKLPEQFNEAVRPDVIKRAVEVIQSRKRQPYGAYPEAGKRASAKLSRRRRDYKGSYGIGISRVPRKILSRRGTRMNWVAAFAPGTVGGRNVHPPKASKKWSKSINKKERKKAIRSALSAVVIPDLVKQRGHIIPEHYPFIVENKFEDLKKTKEVTEALVKLGFREELERAIKKNIRAGKGKARGRKYKIKKSVLLVVSKKSPVMKAASNITGVDVVEVKNLNCELLAPGAVPGRATVFTENSIVILEKNKLFE